MLLKLLKAGLYQQNFISNTEKLSCINRYIANSIKELLNIRQIQIDSQTAVLEEILVRIRNSNTNTYKAFEKIYKLPLDIKVKFIFLILVYITSI